MLVSHLDLDSAVAEGIISRDQAVRLRDLSRRESAGRAAPIDFSQDTRDEPFRLLRGFRDFFIAIGVFIFAVGLTAVALQMIGKFSFRHADLTQVPNGSFGALLIVFGLCVLGFLQAELITRKLRLPLSSLVVSIAVAIWSAALLVLATTNLILAVSQDGVQALRIAKGVLGWAAIGGAIAGTALFYWRYRLPFALFLLAGAFVGLLLLIAVNIMGAVSFMSHIRELVGFCGLATFAVAMWFDAKDRLRVTRFSECAFWLHLCAAPLLVHALLFTGPFGTPHHVFVLAIMAVFSVVALLIDRRALLVSGLSYFGFAISRFVLDSSFFSDQSFAPTALILGGTMLTLGLGWTPIRRGVLAALPFEALKSCLPPGRA